MRLLTIGLGLNDEPAVAGLCQRKQYRPRLKVLKRRMQREGVLREMRQHRCYEKPSEKKTRQRAERTRRIRKQARKQAVRDGLIPASRKKRTEGASGGAIAQDRAPDRKAAVTPAGRGRPLRAWLERGRALQLSKLERKAVS
jgi:small subunit ribosomal protein S21